MRGSIAKKGKRWYAVVYDGMNPAAGNCVRRWVPAGTRRADAEKLLADLVKRRHESEPVVGEKGTFGSYLGDRWLPVQQSGADLGGSGGELQLAAHQRLLLAADVVVVDQLAGQHRHDRGPTRVVDIGRARLVRAIAGSEGGQLDGCAVPGPRPVVVAAGVWRIRSAIRYGAPMPARRRRRTIEAGRSRRSPTGNGGDRECSTQAEHRQRRAVRARRDRRCLGPSRHRRPRRRPPHCGALWARFLP